jgi:hypothetical protein
LPEAFFLVCPGELALAGLFLPEAFFGAALALGAIAFLLPQHFPAGAARQRGSRRAMALRPALKVKAKWLRLMQGDKVRGRAKTVEVRKYAPWQRTPRGHRPIRLGERFYLLAAGEVWGSAVLEDVVEYADARDFEAAAEAHCVRARRGPEVRDILQGLARGQKVYGWKLAGMRWFEAGQRPRSGAPGVPEFKGQGKGQVWSFNQLPAELDALPAQL